MPVQETLDGVGGAARRRACRSGTVLVNMVRTAHLADGKRAAVSAAAEKRGGRC